MNIRFQVFNDLPENPTTRQWVADQMDLAKNAILADVNTADIFNEDDPPLQIGYWRYTPTEG